MGTTYQALKDFAENLRSIQLVARAWGVGAVDYELIRPTLNRAVTDCLAQMSLIRPAIQSSTVSDDWKATIDESIVAAFDDTASIVANPAWTEEGPMGKMGQAVPPTVWAEVVASAAKASKSLIRLFTYIIGMTAVGGIAVAFGPGAWARITDPYGLKASWDLFIGSQANCQRAIDQAGTDPVKLAQAHSFCGLMEKWAKDKMPGGSGDCGPLDTPTGTLIGLALGIGFGWAGMRKVMGL
jgi:hypothetical protein